MADVDAVY